MNGERSKLFVSGYIGEMKKHRKKQQESEKYEEDNTHCPSSERDTGTTTEFESVSVEFCIVAFIPLSAFCNASKNCLPTMDFTVILGAYARLFIGDLGVISRGIAAAAAEYRDR